MTEKEELSEEMSINDVDMETKTSEDEVSYRHLVKENEDLKKQNAKLVKALNGALELIGRNYAQSVAAELLKDEK